MQDDMSNHNNHLKGTEYTVNYDDPRSPIRRGVFTIDGVVLRFSVFPERTSKNGKPYFPIAIQYMPDGTHILRAEPVDNGCKW